jgi:anti-anti-sigma factor
VFASRIDKNHDTTVWHCCGALDSYSASRARQDLSSLGSCDRLVVDLTECVFIDCGGLRIVEEAAASCGATEVIIRTSDPRIWDLLRIAGLDRVFVVEAVEPSEGETRIRRIRTAASGRSRPYRRSEPPLRTHSSQVVV